jgi:dienelactone hydrolase
MLPLFAKWLDRYVIWTAGRRMRRAPRAVLSSARNVPRAALSFENDVVLPEITFSSATEFRFASVIRTRWDENNIVHGQLFRSGKDWRRKPTVIMLHGWNADHCYRHQFPRFARHLERAGINTAMIELPYHCQRRPSVEGSVRNFISEDLHSMLQATEQSVADIRSLRRWLREQGNPAVGLWGFSLGAWLTGLTICADDQFDFATLLTPVVRVDRAVAELDFCEPIRRALEQTSVPLEGLDLLTRRPRIPRERILLIESKYDVFLPPETVEELWRAWDQPEIRRVNHGHISIMMSRSVLKRVVGWIASKAIPEYMPASRKRPIVWPRVRPSQLQE